MRRSLASPSLGRRALLAAGASLALPLGGAVITACGDDDTTTGKRVKLATKVALVEGGASFTSGLDWDVSLTRALLATGPFYYFGGEAAVTALLSAFALRSAHAHPGHYDSGDALGQMLEPFSVDLLAGEATFPDGSGVTGLYRSAEFSFAAPAAGPLGEQLGGAVAMVAGSASKAGEDTRHFRGVATLSDLEKSAAEGRVQGCVLEEVEVADDGVIHVSVAPHAWFNLVDFSKLDPGSEDEPTEFEAGTQPSIAFAQGLAQIAAYSFRYSRG
jgi:hypothetical protein